MKMRRKGFLKKGRSRFTWKRKAEDANEDGEERFRAGVME